MNLVTTMGVQNHHWFFADMAGVSAVSAPSPGRGAVHRSRAGDAEGLGVGDSRLLSSFLSEEEADRGSDRRLGPVLVGVRFRG